jgi:hypothetical protein
MGRSTFIVIALAPSLVCSGIPVFAAYEMGQAGVTQGEVLMSGIGFFGGNTPTGNLLAEADHRRGCCNIPGCRGEWGWQLVVDLEDKI